MASSLGLERGLALCAVSLGEVGTALSDESPMKGCTSVASGLQCTNLAFQVWSSGRRHCRDCNHYFDLRSSTVSH
jgi:hypothetical protein